MIRSEQSVRPKKQQQMTGCEMRVAGVQKSGTTSREQLLECMNTLNVTRSDGPASKIMAVTSYMDAFGLLQDYMSSQKIVES